MLWRCECNACAAENQTYAHLHDSKVLMAVPGFMIHTSEEGVPWDLFSTAKLPAKRLAVLHHIAANSKVGFHWQHGKANVWTTLVCCRKPMSSEPGIP